MLPEKEYGIYISYDGDQWFGLLCFPSANNRPTTLREVDEFFSQYYNAEKYIQTIEVLDMEHIGVDIVEKDEFGDYSIIVNPVLYGEDADVLDVEKTNKEFEEYLNNPGVITSFILSIIKYCDLETSRQLMRIVYSIVIEKKEYDVAELQRLLSGLTNYVFDRVKYLCLKEYKNKEYSNTHKNNEVYYESVTHVSGGKESNWFPPKK